MNFNFALIIYSTLIFALCTSAFIIRSIRSYNFRNKIALPHGFSEGIMTGAAYPALITTISLLFIQLASFIAFKSPSETVCAIRMGCYLLTVAVFIVLFMKTPILLAYWFDQNGLWLHSCRKGKIPYSEIYNAQLSKKIRLPIVNNQQLCKFTFYVKDKNIFFHPKKFVCKMTAYEISALSRQVEFTETPAKTETKRIRAAHFALPIVLFAICIVSIAQFCASGILNEVRYRELDMSELEIQTITSPSDIGFRDGYLFVYFDSLKKANVYTPTGNFISSTSITAETMADMPDEYEGKKYGANSFGVWCSSENGEKNFLINYPIISTIFNTELLWIINTLLIVTAIMLRGLADEYKRPAKVITSEENEEFFKCSPEKDIAISDISDETAAS